MEKSDIFSQFADTVMEKYDYGLIYESRFIQPCEALTEVDYVRIVPSIILKDGTNQLLSPEFWSSTSNRDS